MLHQENIHAAKVEVFTYSNGETFFVLHETFEKRKDFIAKHHHETIYASGEGGIDWSVWIVKNNIVGQYKVLYGSMLYHSIIENVIGAASLLLIRVSAEIFDKCKPGYIELTSFQRSHPKILQALAVGGSKIMADFDAISAADISAISREAVI